MSRVSIELPPKLIPIFEGQADVRGAYGGRGSGKTRSFAIMAAVYGYRMGNAGQSGVILCARQWMNSLDDSSLEELKRAIETYPFLTDYYDVSERSISSRDGRITFSFAGLERNITSIKSKGRILLCWVDEAENVNDTAWDTLIPTLREEGNDGGFIWQSELWVSWNPKRRGSATDIRFRQKADPSYKIVELNWRDNPKFPAILERKRQHYLNNQPELYEHVWEGGYATVTIGAYYAKHILQSKQEGRICPISIDPLMSIRAFWDIGGTGQRADACAIWIAQFIGREIYLLDYYEAIGQPLATHVNWLRKHGYGDALIVLPHDGANHEKIERVTYQSALESAGFSVEVVKNQGAGAAMARVEALRRIFKSLWFNVPRESIINEHTDIANTQSGIDTLGCYHEKFDDKRQIGLGPEHDFSSHCADAIGLMAVYYETEYKSNLMFGKKDIDYSELYRSVI